jgi:hypothetical protein
MQKKPCQCVLQRIDGSKDLWALNGSVSIFEPDHKILLEMGKILERVYTLSPDEFHNTFSKSVP